MGYSSRLKMLIVLLRTRLYEKGTIKQPSQSALSAYLQISQSLISNWERETTSSPLSEKTLEKLYNGIVAAGFNLSLDKLKGHLYAGIPESLDFDEFNNKSKAIDYSLYSEEELIDTIWRIIDILEQRKMSFYDIKMCDRFMLNQDQLQLLARLIAIHRKNEPIEVIAREIAISNDLVEDILEPIAEQTEVAGAELNAIAKWLNVPPFVLHQLIGGESLQCCKETFNHLR